MKKNLICISCPNGCRLEVEYEDDKIINISGHKCKRGIEYGREEVLRPKRVVTAAAPTDSGDIPYVSVKTDKPILKDKIFPLLREIYSRKAKTPVKCGETLIENFMDSGVNVVYTRNAGFNSIQG